MRGKRKKKKRAAAAVGVKNSVCVCVCVRGQEREILFGPVAACMTREGEINDLSVICNCFKLVVRERKRKNNNKKGKGA